MEIEVADWNTIPLRHLLQEGHQPRCKHLNELSGHVVLFCPPHHVRKYLQYVILGSTLQSIGQTLHDCNCKLFLPSLDLLITEDLRSEVTGFPDLRRPVDIVDPSIRTPDNLDDPIGAILAKDGAERTTSQTCETSLFEFLDEAFSVVEGLLLELHELPLTLAELTLDGPDGAELANLSFRVGGVGVVVGTQPDHTIEGNDATKTHPGIRAHMVNTTIPVRDNPFHLLLQIVPDHLRDP